MIAPPPRYNQGLGTAILVGRRDRIRSGGGSGRHRHPRGIESSRCSSRRASGYTDHLYERQQHLSGFALSRLRPPRPRPQLLRLVDGRAPATPTRWSQAPPVTSPQCWRTSARLIDAKPPAPRHRHLADLARGRYGLVAPTRDHRTADRRGTWPTSPKEAAGATRRLGTSARRHARLFQLRPATGRHTAHVRRPSPSSIAVVDFEYDGEINQSRRRHSIRRGWRPIVLPPRGPANVLIMPAFHVPPRDLVGHAARPGGKRHRDQPAPGRSRQTGADRCRSARDIDLISMLAALTPPTTSTAEPRVSPFAAGGRDQRPSAVARARLSH